MGTGPAGADAAGAADAAAEAARSGAGRGWPARRRSRPAGCGCAMSAGAGLGRPGAGRLERAEAGRRSGGGAHGAQLDAALDGVGAVSVAEELELRTRILLCFRC